MVDSATGNKPAVSVVIPCYNVEAFLPEVLDSALGQTLENIEVICVNDGSTDKTLEIIQDYANRDSRVVVIDKPNGGYGHTMNVGMDAATGTYIGILESDDYIISDMYEKLYAAAEAHDLDFVRSDFYKFRTGDDGKRIIWEEKLSSKPEYYNVVMNPRENLDVFNMQMMNWTGIYRTTFIRDHHIRHNESPGASYQDNGFWFQTYCWAEKMYVLDEPFYCYRQDNAASSINQDNKVFCMPDEYAWIRQFLVDNPELERDFISIYHYKKTHNLNFAFSLLAPDFQMPFLERYAEEYREADKKGELDKGLFWPDEWETLSKIMDDPAAYRDEFNERNTGRSEYEREYEKARSQGKVALLKFHMKHEGLAETMKMTSKSLFGSGN